MLILVSGEFPMFGQRVRGSGLYLYLFTMAGSGIALVILQLKNVKQSDKFSILWYVVNGILFYGNKIIQTEY